MNTYTMYYPGDQPTTVEVLTHEEFFALYPPEKRKITVKTGSGIIVSETHMNDRVLCDICGAPVLPPSGITLVGRRKVYCVDCVESIRRYIR